MASDTSNPNLKVQKVSFEENVNKWNHPFRCIIAGPTNSGRTSLVLTLLSLLDMPPKSSAFYKTLIIHYVF